MKEKDIKNYKPTSRLILACFLVLAATAAGLFAAYSVFSNAAFKKQSENKPKFHSANPPESAFYENLYKFPRKKIDFSAAPIAGIIPHHLLAGDLIAEFFSNLENYDYETIVLLGPNHFNAGEGKIISSAEDWQTPYGLLPADREILKKLAAGGETAIEEDIFSQEHSISSEVAFIKKTFPRAKFLPLALRANLNRAEAEKLAEALYQISLDKKILVISSTDFSHYKTSAQAQADDAESLKILNNFSFENVYKMAVDSPPATYALMKYASFSGADFIKLNNSNSALLSGKEDVEKTTSYITGYFAPRPDFKDKEEKSALPPAADKELNFLFFGDLMLDRKVGEKIKASGTDYIFSDLFKEGFGEGNDLLSANLEGAVADSGAHYKPDMAYDFSFAPELIEGLKKYGFNFFNIANNHLSDQGEIGIMETRENLKKMGFDFSGCQDREISDCTAALIEKNGKKIALAGFSMVYGDVPEKKLLEKISALAAESDILIVQPHWGIEYEHQPAKNQIALAHKLIEAGADLIIGHHPHVVGGMEIYQGKIIFYSLGNFVFDQYFSLDTQEELAAKIKFGEENISAEILPIKSDKSRLRLLAGEEKKVFLKKLAAWSNGDEKFKEAIISGTIFIKNK